MAPLDASGDDRILPFQVAQSPVRGRVVRLGRAADALLSAHPFDAPVLELVGEAAALVALMGSSLKFDGKLILQAQGDGPLSMVVADYAASGALRATAMRASDAPKGARGLTGLLGAGHMALTVDQGPDMERYQGVTPLEGGDFATAAVSYFRQSEQIPTAVKLAVGRVARPGAAETWRVGGIIAQFIPGEGGGRARGEAALQAPEEEDLWRRAVAHIETVQADELLDPGLSAESLLYRLFHEDGVRVFDPVAVRAECSCNAERIGRVLERYEKASLADMVEDGAIRVGCEFCRRTYLFDDEGQFMRMVAPGIAS
ncbi:MAG: Hsp33 family molecular chaperone [Parvularculaceae bacterium]|nr:Hsp33 family molecular chaperone [Parvularculaceae bacterium]